MSDHGDHAVAEHDLTDLYVFRKPGDPARTILVMDVDPDVVPGVPPPRAQPFDPGARYDFMIDADGDAVPDSVFRITFSNDDAGRQAGTVRRLAGGDVASKQRRWASCPPRCSGVSSYRTAHHGRRGNRLFRRSPERSVFRGPGGQTEQLPVDGEGFPGGPQCIGDRA